MRDHQSIWQQGRDSYSDSDSEQKVMNSRKNNFFSPKNIRIVQLSDELMSFKQLRNNSTNKKILQNYKQNFKLNTKRLVSGYTALLFWIKPIRPKLFNSALDVQDCHLSRSQARIKEEGCVWRKSLHRIKKQRENSHFFQKIALLIN